MIFAGIDVNIVTHEKMVTACAGGDLAPFGLWTFGMCHAQLHETNGRLARPVVLAALGGRRNIMIAKKLVDAGLWIANEDGSWQIWNYGKKNQTAEEIREKREKSAERVKAWRDRRNAHVTPPEPRNEQVRTDPPPEPPPPPDNTTRTNLFGEASPPAEPTGAPRSRRKPETPCPESGASAGEIRDWAERWKIPVGHGEFTAFLDHHRKADKRWRDWAATWRTWLANASKFAARGGYAKPAEITKQPGDLTAPWLQDGYTGPSRSTGT